MNINRHSIAISRLKHAKTKLDIENALLEKKAQIKQEIEIASGLVEEPRNRFLNFLTSFSFASLF